MSFYEYFKTYKSVKFIEVENFRLSLTFTILQIVVFLYILVYTIIIQKGYQAYDTPIGTTSLKTKGTGIVYGDDLVYNADDLVYPKTENGAFFITTRYIRTNQTRGICEGNKDSGKCPDCKAGDLNWAGNGEVTGNCQEKATYCDVKGWCPVENDKVNIKVVDNVGNFTIFYKVNVRFPNFKVDKSNAQESVSTSPQHGYNLLSVKDMVEMAGSTWEDASTHGAILLFTTTYDCNIDKKEKDQCEPKFKVARVDNVKGTISSGFNFRTTEYDSTGNSRILTKRYGIRIIFEIDGEAGKFNLAALSTTIGAGLSFLAIASLVCDYMMDNCLQDSERYNQKKYQGVSARRSSQSFDHIMHQNLIPDLDAQERPRASINDV